jgi:hypothetical protein
MKRLAFVLVVVATPLLAASASGGTGVLPPGFPTSWTTTASVPAGISRSAGVLMGVQRSSSGTVLIHTVDQVRAEKQLGYVYKQFEQRRVKGGTVTCGAKSYTGPYTMNVNGNAGNGWFGFVTLQGAIQLEITHEVEVAPTPTGPPSCREDSGTWTGNIPPLAGRKGTWTESPDGVFVFS